MNSDSSQNLDTQYPDFFAVGSLSIALIGPDAQRRNAVARALGDCHEGGEFREFSSYPPSLDDVPRLLEQHYNVIVIDLDSDREYALELVESICANGSSTVMVYSEKDDPELILRCMRSGVREFLTLPFSQNTMAEALVRAAARRPAPRTKKAGGKLLVFFGAKGGAGVTTIACNLAVALAQEPNQSTLLIDLDLPLGDAALNLGLEAEYSTINALQESGRLDSRFLSTLLVKHSSGLNLLAAPGKFPQYQASNEAIERLLMVARQEFDNVVVDVGSSLDFVGTALYKEARTIYLVTQTSIPELRNSNRLIGQFFTGATPKLEIVINRHQPRTLGVGDDLITKALTRAPNWQIPNDFAAVRQMQNTATPLVLEDSPISRIIREMASSITGQPVPQEKKKGFSFRSFARSNPAKSATPEEPLNIARLIPSPTSSGLTPNSGGSGWASGVTPPTNGRANKPEPVIYSPTASASLAAELRPFPEASTSAELPTSTEVPAPAETPTYTFITDLPHLADTSQEITQIGSTFSEQSEPPTRVYKGATYIKAPDGKWHLKPVPSTAAPEENVPEEGALQESESQETPTIEWPAPDSITHGTALNATQLNAKASVPGKFFYAPAAGYVLPMGTHTIWVTFTPKDSATYATTQAAVSITVTRATPALTWPAPDSISYGTELSAIQLNATAPIPGTFAYIPAAGEVLTSGIHTLSVTFTPTDDSAYSTAQYSVPLTVVKVTPAVNWPAPDSIPYGTELNATQLNATASVPGRFTYSPGAGEVLTSGKHKLAATFWPTEDSGYNTVQAKATIEVTKVTPTINWPVPDSIPYGTALSANELNATSPVPGKFVYIPAAGAVLSAGTHTPWVFFTPNDTKNYIATRATVQLTVTKDTPTITWPTPASIAYGNALGDSELNATASVPGTFEYTPAAGTILTEGIQALSVAFTPTDTADYTTAAASVTIIVTNAAPTTIAWPTPAAISYGTALGDNQLNASASIPGTFHYSPSAGEVLEAGTHQLSLTFTPADSHLPQAHASVSLTVTKATPTVIWPTPSRISYGTPLGDTQFNATASVPGIFVYTPGEGEVLHAGMQRLSVTFTPNDAVNYTTAEASVALTVTRVKPAITWPTTEPIPYGTPLSAAQLNATASVPGTFVYTPAAGNVLTSGVQTLAVAFTPTDTANYTSAQATVSLVVEGFPGIDSLDPGADLSSTTGEETSTATDNTGRTNLTDTNGEAFESGTADQQMEPETRIYKGATYVKGTDGKWHFKQM